MKIFRNPLIIAGIAGMNVNAAVNGLIYGSAVGVLISLAIAAGCVWSARICQAETLDEASRV